MIRKPVLGQKVLINRRYWGEYGEWQDNQVITFWPSTCHAGVVRDIQRGIHRNARPMIGVEPEQGGVGLTYFWCKQLDPVEEASVP